MTKLYNYGVRGPINDWFRDYLANRKQFVAIGESVSELRMIRCGVPQGSVLGPLLFLIYVNDICNISDQCTVKLFADDTNVFVFGKDSRSAFCTFCINICTPFFIRTHFYITINLDSGNITVQL